MIPGLPYVQYLPWIDSLMRPKYPNSGTVDLNLIRLWRVLIRIGGAQRLVVVGKLLWTDELMAKSGRRRVGGKGYSWVVSAAPSLIFSMDFQLFIHISPPALEPCHFIKDCFLVISSQKWSRFRGDQGSIKALMKGGGRERPSPLDGCEALYKLLIIFESSTTCLM